MAGVPRVAPWQDWVWVSVLSTLMEQDMTAGEARLQMNTHTTPKPRIILNCYNGHHFLIQTNLWC